MLASEIEQILFEELGYAGTPGLLTDADAIPWPNGRAIPHISAALFLEHQPLAYFSRFSELDPDVIRQELVDEAYYHCYSYEFEKCL